MKIRLIRGIMYIFAAGKTGVPTADFVVKVLEEHKEALANLVIFHS